MDTEEETADQRGCTRIGADDRGWIWPENYRLPADGWAHRRAPLRPPTVSKTLAIFQPL